jgi:multidrug transporter EmrE-like cation transporter
MSFQTIFYILSSISLSVLAQILLKKGMTKVSMFSVDTSNSFFPLLKSVIFNSSIIFGFSAYFLSAGIWLLVLSKVDVSKAYPFVSLGFIGTMVCAYIFLQEPITPQKIAGTLLVLAGVIVISK